MPLSNHYTKNRLDSTLAIWMGGFLKKTYTNEKQIKIPSLFLRNVLSYSLVVARYYGDQTADGVDETFWNSLQHHTSWAKEIKCKENGVFFIGLFSPSWCIDKCEQKILTFKLKQLHQWNDKLKDQIAQYSQFLSASRLKATPVFTSSKLDEKWHY